VRLVAWRGDADARRFALALEAHSAHPLARAIVAGLADAGVAPAERVDDVEETTGAGITGVVAGRAVAIGSPRFVERLAGELGALGDQVARFADAGISPVVIALDGRAVAVAGLADPLRDDARATVERLRAAGWDVAMLSGDHPSVVARVAAELGLPESRRRGGVTPEGKLAVVHQAQGRGPVVMVGDGVNDAAALAAAGCGIAVHGGAEAATSVADIVITPRDGERGVARVAEVIEAARATRRVVWRNFAISITYNLAGASLAVTGLIHPLIAALMMPLSSLTVVSSAAWTRAFTPRRSR
jgi:Cu2+-exporting ATPase